MPNIRLVVLAVLVKLSAVRVRMAEGGGDQLGSACCSMYSTISADVLQHFVF